MWLKQQVNLIFFLPETCPLVQEPERLRKVVLAAKIMADLPFPPDLSLLTHRACGTLEDAYASPLNRLVDLVHELCLHTIGFKRERDGRTIIIIISSIATTTTTIATTTTTS